MGISQDSIDALLTGTAEDVGALDAATGTATIPAPALPQVTPPAAPRPPAAGSSTRQQEVRRILHLSVPLIVTLAECGMSVEAILRTTVGSIIEFDQAFDAELVLSVANCSVGKGQAVKVGENFGLRITHIGTVEERIDAMAGG